MAGYTRQSAASIVALAEISAAPLNAEFNQLQTAFNSVTGHGHSGGAGDGPKIVLTTGVSGTLPIANGGTGAITAALARISLGLEIGVNVQAFDADLSALAANATDGFWAHTGAGTGAARTLTATANEIGITNTQGIAGNPVFSLPTALTFTGKTVTGGTFTGGTFTTGTFSGTTFTGGTGSFTTLSASNTLNVSLTSGINPMNLATTDPGPNGNFIDIFHNSPSPAVSDIITSISYTGNSTTAVKRTYGQDYTQITDATNGTEDSSRFYFNIVNGSQVAQMTMTATGMQIPAIGATTPGTGGFTAINATSIGATTPGTGSFTTLNSTTGGLNGTIGAITPAVGTFTTLTSTGGAVNGTLGATTPAAATITTLTSTGVTTLKGSTTNDSAAAGNVGEVISASVASGSAVTMVTATDKTITSISLTAGDWDVYGNIALFPGATTSVTKHSQSLSIVNNTQDATEGLYAGDQYAAIVMGGTAGGKVMSPLAARFSLSGTTTVYLVANSVFTVAGMAIYGKLWARRAR